MPWPADSEPVLPRQQLLQPITLTGEGGDVDVEFEWGQTARKELAESQAHLLGQGVLPLGDSPAAGTQQPSSSEVGMGILRRVTSLQSPFFLPSIDNQLIRSPPPSGLTPLTTNNTTDDRAPGDAARSAYATDHRMCSRRNRSCLNHLVTESTPRLPSVRPP